MPEPSSDRRVQRTRDALRRALMQLVDEKGYDAVTIQDITERANLGRTTFYLHYEDKDALMLDHHEDFASQLTLRTMSAEELLGDVPPDDLTTHLQELADHKRIYLAITRARGAEPVLRGVHKQMADVLLENLRDLYPDQEPRFGIDLLVNYIVNAHFSTIDWWMINRTGHSAGDVATLLHHLRRAAIRDAYGIPPDGTRSDEG